MTERRRPRLYVVASAPEGVGGRVAELLASGGVPSPPGPVRVALNGLARTAAATGEGGVSPHDTEALRTALKAPGLPSAAAWRLPAVSPTLGTLLDSIDVAGAWTSMVLAWDEPSAVADAAAPSARPLSLARWELAVLDLLAAARRHECLVLPPGDGPDVQEMLVRHLGDEPASVTGGPERRSGPASDEESPSEQGDVLRSQRDVAETLRFLAGPHASLASLELPGPGAWTAAIAAAEHRARVAAMDAADAWSRPRPGVPRPVMDWEALARTSGAALRRWSASRRRST